MIFLSSRMTTGISIERISGLIHRLQRRDGGFIITEMNYVVGADQLAPLDRPEPHRADDPLNLIDPSACAQRAISGR